MVKMIGCRYIYFEIDSKEGEKTLMKRLTKPKNYLLVHKEESPSSYTYKKSTKRDI